MKFLPYENYFLTTKLTPKQVSLRLQENIIPVRVRKSVADSSNITRLYEGYVERNEFQISRIIKYGNSFLPNINGDIYDANGGSRINIKMKMHEFISLLMVIWISAVSLGFVVSIADIINKKKFEPAVFLIFFLLAFGYSFFLYLFKYESKKGKIFLSDLFETKISN